MRLWSRPPLCTVTRVPLTLTTILAASTLKATSLRRQKTSPQMTTCHHHLCQSTATAATRCDHWAGIWILLRAVQAARLGSASAQLCPSSSALTSTFHSTPTQATQVILRAKVLLPPQPPPPQLPPWARVAIEGATLWVAVGTLTPQLWTACPCLCTRPQPLARTCQRAARSPR